MAGSLRNAIAMFGNALHASYAAAASDQMGAAILSTMENEPPTDRLSLSRILARKTNELEFEALPSEVVEKVKIAFLDFLSCALEAGDLPWSRQAIGFATLSGGPCAIIGTAHRCSAADAALANAVLGHGLVREDMHTAAISHLGVVVFPTLVALARDAAGRDFIAAAVAGYEAGAALGVALVDRAIAKQFRPTGITGPIGGAVAGCRLLRADEDTIVNATGLAANTASGLNEWAVAGGEEMFFHPGFAARSAVTAVELARCGAKASQTALCGYSGLFAGLGRADRIGAMTPFDGAFEIMSVYHKPAPACNYAQTACQAALALASRADFDSASIASIAIKASDMAINYPGCNFKGPFTGALQAKMSIPFSVAAVLSRRSLEEQNYRDLAASEILRLVSVITLESDAAFTAAYPSAQGAQVTARCTDGRVISQRLDDLTPAQPGDIRARFRSACTRTLGPQATSDLEHFIDNMEHQTHLNALGDLLSSRPQ